MSQEEQYNQDIVGVTNLLIQLNYNDEFFNLSKEIRQEIKDLLLMKFTLTDGREKN